MTARPTPEDAAAALTAPGQLFEMQDAAVLGRHVRTWKHAPASLRTVLDLSLAHGEAEFCVYEDERTTFAAHYRTAATLAHRLREDLHVRKGDRVAIAMRNLPQWVAAFWAVVGAGAVVVPLNAWWTADELAYALDDSGSVACFCDTERAERVGAVRDRLSALRAVVVVDDARAAGPGAQGPRAPGPGEIPFPELLGAVDPEATPPDVAVDPDDDATIFYTSGTTGRPKGAVGTHRNACSTLMSFAYLQAAALLRDGEALGAPAGGGQRCTLLTVPLFHATGCHAVLVPATAAGSRLVLMHHFDPARALELIERERVSLVAGVPTVVVQLLDCPDIDRRDVSSVRSVSYGGSPAPPDLERRVRAAFPVGQPGNGYGLTETSALTTYISGADYAERPGSVGRPVPVTDVAVGPSPPTGPPGPPPRPGVPGVPGVPGELWVRGPQVVRGYWNRPDDTAQAFVGGWLRTGDVAALDADGYVSIVDRAKDVVIRGGENVYPAEVEAVLLAHPSVAECAVVGVPDPTLGEEVGAVVVLRGGHKVAADELARHVRRRLPPFAVPTRWWLRPGPLARNPAGKLLKRTLRAELLGEAQPVDGEGRAP